MRYRGKYFPALWLNTRGHPTCRRRRACVAGHVSLVRACSGQRFPLVIRRDAYIRCGLHPWAPRKRKEVFASWLLGQNILRWTDFLCSFSPPALPPTPVPRMEQEGEEEKGRQDENIVIEPVKQPDGDALVTFTMMLRTIKKTKTKKTPQ